MQIKDGYSALVTGGASGLGLATAKRLLKHGASVVIVDLPTSDGHAVAERLGERAHFVAADVTSPEEVGAAAKKATEVGEFRIVVHCAGIGGPMRLVQKDGSPGDFAHFQKVINTNLMGTLNVASQTAAVMAQTEPEGQERGCIIFTASVAGYEGQIGQASYAASKGGVIGLTICAARDLASKKIRVCSIAPGTVDTPLLARLSQEVRDSLGAMVPHPARLVHADEFAQLAESIVQNPMLNGETIRLDGAIRMGPR